MISAIVAIAKEVAKTCETIKVAEIAKVKEFGETGKIILEPNIDIAKGKSLESVKQMNLENGFERIPTRNQQLEGQKHNETGIPFNAKVVENSKGELIEVVVPKFDSIFDAKLPDGLLESNDYEQFAECNSQLKETMRNNSEINNRFTEEQREQIMDGETPDGVTWHHDAEKGKMQLVDAKIHAQTGHTGGKVIWGGGNGNR